MHLHFDYGLLNEMGCGIFHLGDVTSAIKTSLSLEHSEFQIFRSGMLSVWCLYSCSKASPPNTLFTIHAVNSPIYINGETGLEHRDPEQRTKWERQSQTQIGNECRFPPNHSNIGLGTEMRWFHWLSVYCANMETHIKI